MKLCPTCGFGLWLYNHDTYTCKHGHQFTDEALKAAPVSVNLVAAKPRAPWQPTPPAKRSLLPLAACFVAGLAFAVLLLVVSGANAATTQLGSRTFDQACQAAAAGDVITVPAGSFGSQTITCTKAVTIQGSGETTRVGYVAFSKANGPTVAGMTLTAGAEFKGSANVAIRDSTINNLVYVEGSQDVLMSGNTHAPAPGGTSWSNGDMVDIYEQTGRPANARITIQDSTFHGLRAPSASAHSDAIQLCNCGSTIPTGIKILRNRFYDNECMNVRTNDRDGVLLENNLIGDTVRGISGCGDYSLDVLAANATVRYNTFTGSQRIQVNTSADTGQSQTWVGNAGVGMSSACGAIRATYSHNVWTAQKCGSTDVQVPALKLNQDGFPSPGSPLVDAGDPLVYPSTDLLGVSRVRGPFADAGAIETGAVTPPPPPADRDGDGVADNVDACPDVAGTQPDGCKPPPPPDPCAQTTAERDKALADLATMTQNRDDETARADAAEASRDAWKLRAEKAEDQVARIKLITGE